MNRVTRVMCISIVTNIFLSIMKMIVGVLGKSSALLADGIHSLSDLTTDVFAIVGSFLSRKPADSKHPFGHGKIEYITSLTISVVIMIVGFSIIGKSMTEKVMMPSILVAVVSLITITLKFLLSNFIIRKGKEYENQILLASGQESRTDVMSSVVVLIASLLMQLTFISPLFQYADKVASIIVGIFIIKVGFDILKENLGYIIGEQETNTEYKQSVEKIVLGIDGIVDIEEVILLKYGFYYKLIGVVYMDGNLTLKEAHKKIDILEEKLRKFDSKIKYITIHMEPAYE